MSTAGQAPAAVPVAPALRGVLLVLAAVLLFALMDTSTKLLAAHYPVPLVIAARYFGNLLLLAAIMLPRHGWALVRTQRTGLVLVRAASLAFCSLMAGLALQRMPVAETSAIIFLAPFAVLLLAGPLLGERASPFVWLAAALGFAGVLLIVRPGGGLDPLGVGYAVLCAAGTAVYYLLSRVLARTESTMALLFWTALAGAVLFGAILPWNWRGGMPSLLDGTLLVGIGALALAGHALFTAAYRYASASLLSPVNYMQLVWAGVLGWLFFAHVPDAIATLGIGLIALSGAAIAFKTHRDKLRN